MHLFVSDYAPTEYAPAAVESAASLAEIESLRETVAALWARIETIESNRPRLIQYQIGTAAAGPVIAGARPELDALLRMAAAASPARRNFWLYGPPGTGKSVLASSMATALGLDYTELQINVATTPAALFGSPDAAGHWHESDFCRIWSSGGVILLDELTTNQDLAGALNNALANGTLALGRHHDAGRRALKRHADTYVIVADNTTGRGNTGGTLTRCRLDAASMDRFIGRMLFVGYWRDLEERLGGPLAEPLWALREVLGSAWPVTTRTFTAAADYLAAGWSETETAKQLLAGAEAAVIEKAKTAPWWREALA